MAVRVNGAHGSPRGNRGNQSVNRGTVAPRPKSVPPAAEVNRSIEIPRSVTVKQLADIMGIGAIEIIKELMKNGIMASINQAIDYDSAAIVASDLGYEVVEQAAIATEESTMPADQQRVRRPVEEDTEALKIRPPVVTIMGHVDHGKTSLLDAIRETRVTDTEAGGITQHIGAYQVEVSGKKITFLDTPGHEAFTAMRARGAQATDIAILVVAADDGVMPQTIEAIDHAKAAGVPIVVAINKIDKPNANPDRVKQELADHSLLIEEWGGDVICVPVSAKQRVGIQELLENILIVAEVSELNANPDRPAVGIVIEAELDKTKGPLATVLVQTGTLKMGDCFVVGDIYGKVKAMYNDKGKIIKKAGPSVPVEILGLNGVPQAGDIFMVEADEKTARQVVQDRLKERELESSQPSRAFSLDEVFSQIQAGKVKDLNLILKTDVQGSIDPIRSSLEKLVSDQVRVRVIHTGTGSITESDIMLALASKAIIIGFNTRPETGARKLADQEHVDIRQYSVIYNVVEDVEKALAGMLEPRYVEVVEGHAEVRQVFKIGRHEQIAGSFIRDGKAVRNAQVRIKRNGKVIHDGKVSNLKRFKDEVREVLAGFECGITVDNFNEFQEEDVLEFYGKVRSN